VTTLVTLITVWGVLTLAFVVLLIYRSRLTRKETDWIPLTGDEREERAIEEQTLIEMKARKLTLPIRALGTASVVMVLVILGFWLYVAINTPQ
jgi:beta-lactamase regulating signal transducer with metallopeptidase domain